MFKSLLALALSIAAAVPMPSFLARTKENVFVSAEAFKKPQRNRKTVVKPSQNAKRKKKRKAQRKARRINRK